jgi:peptidoglycan/LPS O-acetylase OafA/YrhL
MLRGAAWSRASHASPLRPFWRPYHGSGAVRPSLVANAPDVTAARSGAGTSDGYLPTLDGWRAIAIGLVLFDHAFNSSVCAAGSTRWCNHFMVGQTGVNLFFGLSGLLICTRLLQERQRTARISLRGFYVRRACRILPAALLYLAIITLAALARQILISRTELAASLFFFRNYLSPETGFYTGHFWSLSLEEQFYIVWPTLLLALLLLPGRWPVVVTVLLAASVAVWRHASVALALMLHGQLARGFFLHTGVRADGLLMGAAAALALARGTRPLERVPLWMWGTIVGVYVAVVAHFGLRPTIWESTLVPVMVAWTAYHPRALPSRLLEWPVLRWLGRISYSLYIWQQCFFPPADVAAPLHLVQRWPLGALAAIACAATSYYLLERPAIRLGHRMAPPVAEGRRDLARRPPPAIEAVAA